MFEKKYVPLVFLLAFVFCATGLAAQDSSGVPQEEKTAVYMQVRENLLTAAAAYEGTPYRYTGITESGLDCSGFIYVSFRDALGVSLPRSSSSLHSWVEAISLDNAQSGDLLFFKTNGSRVINHVGLYVGARRFLHAASSGPKTGVIFSSLDERYWTNAYFSAGRVLPEALIDTSFTSNSPDLSDTSDLIDLLDSSEDSSDV